MLRHRQFVAECAHFPWRPPQLVRSRRPRLGTLPAATAGGLQKVGQVGLEPTRPMDSRF